MPGSTSRVGHFMLKRSHSHPLLRKGWKPLTSVRGAAPLGAAEEKPTQFLPKMSFRAQRGARFSPLGRSFSLS